MSRAGERWRSIRIIGFECCQTAAVRDDLDAEYLKQVGLADTPSRLRSPRANIQFSNARPKSEAKSLEFRIHSAVGRR